MRLFGLIVIGLVSRGVSDDTRLYKKEVDNPDMHESNSLRPLVRPRIEDPMIEPWIVEPMIGPGFPDPMAGPWVEPPVVEEPIAEELVHYSTHDKILIGIFGIQLGSLVVASLASLSMLVYVVYGVHNHLYIP